MEKTLHTYVCSSCMCRAIREKCTKRKARRIKRLDHEDIIDAMETELKKESNKNGTSSSTDRRTSVWHLKTLDGINTLFNKKI